MNCRHARIMSVFAKHNDLANVSIPHLNFDHDGYMPELGPFGGDDFSIRICMECGQIQDWKPIADKDVVPQEDEEDADEIAEKALKAKKLEEDAKITAREPHVFGLVNIEERRIRTLLRSEYGDGWEKHDDAIELLNEEANNAADHHTRKAARNILRQINAEFP